MDQTLFIDVGAPLMAYHGTRVGEQFDQLSVDGPPIDDLGESLSSGSGGDPTAFIGAHLAMEYRVAVAFARQDHRWMKSRYDGEKVDPRVLCCAVTLTKPFICPDENDLLAITLRGKVSCEFLQDLAMAADGITDPESDRATDWVERYEADKSFREDKNRWILERARVADRGDEVDFMVVDAGAELGRQARESLKSEGFDGVVYGNKVEGGTSLIAFEPGQVRVLAVDRALKGRPSIERDMLSPISAAESRKEAQMAGRDMAEAFGHDCRL